MSPSGSIMVDPVNDTVSYHASATFTCTADGGPNNIFRWIKGDDISVLDGLIPPLNVNDILVSLEDVVSNDYQLLLDNITGKDDGGIYTCIAINEAGYDTSSITLYVYPEILLHPIDVLVDYGDSVNLTCEADSYPAPMYQWQKMNRISMMFDELDSSVLLLTSVEYENFGRYRCVVTSPELNVLVDSNTALITGINILH